MEECRKGMWVEAPAGALHQDALPGPSNPRGPDLPSGDQGREDDEPGAATRRGGAESTIPRPTRRLGQMLGVAAAASGATWRPSVHRPRRDAAGARRGTGRASTAAPSRGARLEETIGANTPWPSAGTAGVFGCGETVMLNAYYRCYNLDRLHVAGY